jgi:hypothetical protein
VLREACQGRHLYTLTDIGHSTARLKKKPCIRIASLHLCIIAHCTPSGYVRLTADFSLGLVLSSLLSPSFAVVLSAHDHHVSHISQKVGTCAVTPGCRLWYCGKSNLRGSWHFRDLGQSWTILRQSSSTQHEPYHVETSIVRQQGIDIQVSASS